MIVPEKVLHAVNDGHPLRAVQSVWNGGTRQSSKLFALAKAVKAAEDEGLMYPGLWAVVRAKLQRLFSRK